MGYTHYFTQRRSFTKPEWTQVCADIGDILKEIQHNQGIALANGMGDPGTSPEITPDRIYFNGVGDDGHETMCIHRAIPKATAKDKLYKMNPAATFCKTARKPYDAAVTAVLCYLTTCTRKTAPITGEPIIGTEAYIATSDGAGNAFVAGLDMARKAIPRLANVIDIPMDIMKADRWCPPWVSDSTCKGYSVNFCIDGKGYVIKAATGESFCFESHLALAKFLDCSKQATFKTGSRSSHPFGGYGKVEPDIWNASGSFDPARTARIGKAQAKVLARLFPVDPGRAQQPPAYVRPGEMPDNAGRDFCYSIADLFKLAESAA